MSKYVRKTKIIVFPDPMQAMYLAGVEFGVQMAEKGHNLQHTLDRAKHIFQEEKTENEKRQNRAVNGRIKTGARAVGRSNLSARRPAQGTDQRARKAAPPRTHERVRKTADQQGHDAPLGRAQAQSELTPRDLLDMKACVELIRTLKKNKTSFEEARVLLVNSWHCTMGKATETLELGEQITGLRLAR